MKRFIKFSKFTALGNDFIVINDIRGNLRRFFDRNRIKNLCREHFGIGADGLILIEPDKTSSFNMIYFNSDGYEAPMCGNGARVSAFFANYENIAEPTGKFRASDGFHFYTVNGNTVRVSLNINFKSIVMDSTINNYNVSFIDTGVPHGVVMVESLDEFPVDKIGKSIRENREYSKEGVNVDFIEIIDKHNIKMRTFERGVESETYSCGTGATASAIIMTLKSFTKPPINVINRLNEVLKVDFKMKNGIISETTLEGNVKEIAKGYFDVYEY